MRTDKEKALELRRSGKSYKQIVRELDIPLGTLAGWLKKESWSGAIRDQLSKEVSLANPRALEAMAGANRMRWEKLRQGHKESAIKDFPRLKKDPLFMGGLMLYWGVGEKSKNSTLKLSSSDPLMIKTFYLFLIRSLNISPEKINVRLINYPDLVDTVQRTLWSQMTGIPAQQFKRSVVLRGKHPKKRNSYGVCSLTVHSRGIKERVLQWLELSKAELSLPFSEIVF